MKIYIADDASFIRMISRYHVTKAGHEVVGETHDGETAIVEIVAIQPDCVLMDLSMPNKNGAEVIMEVSKNYPQIEFIIVSALDEDVLRSHYPDVGYAVYVKKPFEAEDLLKALKKIEKNQEKQKHG